MQRIFKSLGGKKVCVIRGIVVIPCPICGGRLYHYDSRERSVRIDEELYYYFLLRRLRCAGCRKLHLELPDFLLPNQRCFKAVIEQALRSEPVAVVKDPRTPKRWRKWWTCMSASLRAAFQSLVHRGLIEEPELERPLPDLAKTLVNYGLWPFHLLWDRSRPEILLHSP